MQQLAWTSREFTFDMPSGCLPAVLERLYGTGPRLKALMKGICEEDAATMHENKWSVKQHIGHLHDLEDLHCKRIDELSTGNTSLSAADMGNRKTEESGHNQKSIRQLIQQFQKGRNDLITKITAFNPSLHEHRAMHPRLQTEMRLIDVAYFTAEHDDHHLAIIRQLINRIENRP